MEREKRHEIKPADLILPVVAGVLLYKISTLAYTSDQRRWIHERDGDKCNFPAKHKCNGRHSLHVHHIMPQRYCRDIGMDPDFAENGILICENSHNGEIFPGQPGIHPDMSKARHEYAKNKNSYHDAFDHRDQLLHKGQIYWNDQWDRLLNATAQRNTQRFFNKTHKPFPGKKS